MRRNQIRVLIVISLSLGTVNAGFCLLTFCRLPICSSEKEAAEILVTEVPPEGLFDGLKAVKRQAVKHGYPCPSS